MTSGQRAPHLDSLPVGPGQRVRVAGVINVSPESFFAGSVRTATDALAAQAEAMAREGADLIDLGAMSTAPYKETQIDEAEEIRRLEAAVPVVRAASGLPVSVDTTRAAAAAAALAAGAGIVNAVAGFADPALARVAARSAKGLIIMARERPGRPDDPIGQVRHSWRQDLELALEAGCDPQRIVLDPGIGFFRSGPLPWHEWDCQVLRRLGELQAAGYPLFVGVSRKSFIGERLGRPDPADRLAGSLAVTALAVAQGAAVVRTHDVGATRDAVRMAEAVLGFPGH